MDFNTEAHGQKPQAPVYVWSAPFNPAQHIPPGKDIYVVNYGLTQQKSVVFGDYISTSAEKKTTSAIQTGRPVAGADGNVAAARLTQDGGLTSAGATYCKDHGIQPDVESLTKWAKTHTPENLKYQGYEQAQRQPAHA